MPTVECSPGCSPQPAETAVMGPMRRDPTNRSRQGRHRAKLLRLLWRGKVATCAGPDACLWHLDGEPCACRAGLPCACERGLWDVVERDAAKRFGQVLGGVVTSALVDLARATHTGDEVAIRATRCKLLDILLKDQRGRRLLELQEQRLKLAQPADDGDFLGRLLAGDAPGCTTSRAGCAVGIPGHVPAPDAPARHVDAPAAVGEEVPP